MQIYLTALSDTNIPKDLTKVFSFKNEKALYIDKENAHFSLYLNNGKNVYLFGDIFYHLKNDGTITMLDETSASYLEKLFLQHDLQDTIPALEGQYVGVVVDERNNVAQVFSDRYARLDAFYAETDDGWYLSSDLETLFREIKPVYSQKMLAHLFCVYGWYTPKGLTIYENVKQLRVGEIITLSASGAQSMMMEFKPLKIQDYTDKEMETYYTILKESILARANKKGVTWVSSSSGWDSSILLGMLVNELGADKVKMITGSMQYSEKTATINQFEIDKIKKIGAYYGIDPVIVDFDQKNASAVDYWKKVLPSYKSRHIYSLTTFNFSKLSQGVTQHSGENQTVLNGETSDSFHNFGFSQYVTFFHSKKGFTEYADKMNCYLYGPSFFKKAMDGSYQKDKVFQIFIKMMEGTSFAVANGTREDIIEAYFFPFFYGSPRIPFAQTYNNPALNTKGKDMIYHFPLREYAPEALSGMTEENLYSWYIYLYHSFHSQGSTVNVHKHAMEFNNNAWRSPFNDYRMVDFLSMSPESWGRGLELNHTKYPIKWIAKNKIKFPYDLLQKGPHSYLYDVVEGFSLMAEIIYRSGMSGFFKETLATRSYRDILTDEYLDVKYLDGLVDDYLNGKESKGSDFNNLVSLITLCITGWY